MKLQFKIQPYQTDAVDSVVEVFAGQPRRTGISYKIDPGKVKPTAGGLFETSTTPDSGLRNAEIELSRLSCSPTFTRCRSRATCRSRESWDSKAAPGAPNLDIEMETGTGKTYGYIKTIFELNKRYGWSKFIIVVPCIAIREGVAKSFDDHRGALPADLRQEGPLLHLQLQAAARAGELFARTPAST